MASFEESLHDAEWLAWISTRSPCVTVRRSRGLEVLRSNFSEDGRVVLVLRLHYNQKHCCSCRASRHTVDTEELGIYKIVGCGYACHQGKVIWTVLNNTRYYRG